MHNREVAQIQEISEMFGISKSTILRMVDRGELKPPVRLSKRRLGFIVQEVREAIAAMPRLGEEERRAA